MDTSPLGRLPAELRNDIYERALTCPYPLDLVTANEPNGPVIVFLRKTDHMLALTATCKEIHKDTRLLFFAVNVFLFDETGDPTVPPPNAFPALRLFISTITREAVSSLRKIYVNIGPLACMDFPFEATSCSDSKCFQVGVAALRKWLLARPTLPVTVVIDWEKTPERTVIDLRKGAKVEHGPLKACYLDQIFPECDRNTWLSDDGHPTNPPRMSVLQLADKVTSFLQAVADIASRDEMDLLGQTCPYSERR